MRKNVLFLPAVLLLGLLLPSTASATAQIKVECAGQDARVTIDYQQFSSGPPDVSHTSVRVDGGIRFDQVIAFEGPTHQEVVPVILNDGREHLIEARHQWMHHPSARVVEVSQRITCGTPPVPPAPEQPATPAPTLPATPVAAPAPVAAPPAAERRRAHRRRVRERRERRRIQRRGTAHHRPRSTG